MVCTINVHKYKVVCNNMEEKFDIEKNLLPIESGLASKIYYLAYEQPKSAYEIAFDIYDKYHHSIINKIHELEEYGFFTPIDIEGKKHPKWLSNVEPLIDMIEFRLKIDEDKKNQDVELSVLDKHILRRILDCSFFRLMVGEYFNVEFRGGFNAVEHILMQLDYYFSYCLKSKTFRIISTGVEQSINTTENYESLINEFIQDYSIDRFKDTFNELAEFDPKSPFKDILRNQKKTKETYDVILSSFYMFHIPMSLILKVQGFTIIGKLGPFLSSLSEYTDNFTLHKYNSKEDC